MPFSAIDAEFLLNLGEFRRFLFAAIQSAGIFGHTVSASGAATRDLGLLEGRRALGLELLAMAHAGQSDAVRQADPEGIATLRLCLTEAINSKDPSRERRRNRAGQSGGATQRDAGRYDELPSTE